MELRLSVTEAGDGITCDCADWADAKLVPSKWPVAGHYHNMLDIAWFGEVITCDPGRTDGAHSLRTQEYRAEDVFLETPISHSGGYRVPLYEGNVGCIGLRWLERRR